MKLPAKTRHVSEESEQGEGRESDVVIVAVFKLFSFMRLWLILVAKQPLKERRQRGEREKARERGREGERHHQILCALEQLAELKMLLLTHKQTDTEQQRRGRTAAQAEGGTAGGRRSIPRVFLVFLIL